MAPTHETRLSREKEKQINHRIFPNLPYRLHGLRVLGYTGDGDKASWIKTDLGFDWAFNYKTQDVNQTLKIAAPNGVTLRLVVRFEKILILLI